MVICMNIGTDGQRHIAYMEYDSTLSPMKLQVGATKLKQWFDEVYITDFKENDAFIDEVVLRGCRI